ncbi:MAG: CRISPR-associated protein Cas4 [Oscillospiraceae bacterium]
MEYTEDEYLLLSGIQHFVFCRRQWALIHLEQQWAENFRTADGRIMHKNAHDSEKTEKRGDLIITRGMAVSSAELGLSGECDVVEFRQDKNGIELFGREGRYSAAPVEYKRGEPKESPCDTVQLAAQAMCLEEMLCCRIPVGYLYYGETRHRLKVEIDDELRAAVRTAAAEMHELYRRGHTPKVKRTKACNACSLKDICLPSMLSAKSAREYISEMLGEDGV